MTVYVDDVRWPFGRMIMCHMWADTEEELHDMAAKIGIRRQWFQEPPKASWKHYDISLGKKAEAIARGAVLTDKYGPVEFQARELLSSTDESDRARGQAKLETLARVRGKFSGVENAGNP